MIVTSTDPLSTSISSPIWLSVQFFSRGLAFYIDPSVRWSVSWWWSSWKVWKQAFPHQPTHPRLVMAVYPTLFKRKIQQNTFLTQKSGGQNYNSYPTVCFRRQRGPITLTKIIPPLNSLMASARASMVSKSKWFVGSSRSNMWGFWGEWGRCGFSDGWPTIRHQATTYDS